MSFIDDLAGGGGGKWQTKRIEADNAKRRDFIEQMLAQGRQDLTSGYDTARGIRNEGYQGALDVLGQTIPEMFGAFSQGNLGAQQTVLAGLPQFQNAIMGLPIDMSGMPAQDFGYNTDWAQQTAPGSSLAGVQPGAGGGAVPGGTGGDVGGLGGGGGGAAGGGGGIDPRFVGGGGGLGGGAGGVPQVGSGPNGTWTSSDVDQLFGQGQVAPLWAYNLAEQGGNVGKILGLLSGVPGLGQLGGYLGDKYLGSHTGMTPTDPNNPYASDSDASRALNDAFRDPPSSPIPDPQRQGFGGNYYDPRGSITGGGAYNYATRLRPRGPVAGYYDDPRIVAPKISQDKIGS